MRFGDWTDEAKCKGSSTEAFYPDQGSHATDVKKFCSDCPVRKQCLEAALATPPNNDFGIWGGTSAPQRKKIRRQMRRAA